MARDNTLSLDQVRSIADPVERIKTAKAVMDDHLMMVSDLALVRTQSAFELRKRHSVAEIATMLGVQPQAVYKMLRQTPADGGLSLPGGAPRITRFG